MKNKIGTEGVWTDIGCDCVQCQNTKRMVELLKNGEVNMAEIDNLLIGGGLFHA